MRICFILFVALFAYSSTAYSVENLDFKVRSYPLGNLVYQLDCMAKIKNCSREAYVKLWKQQLNWNDSDDLNLKKWSLLRKKYRGEIKLNGKEASPMALPWSGPRGIQIGHKFSIATTHADSREQLKRFLEVIVAPEDMQRIDEVIDHFSPRFSSWWNKNVKNKVQKNITETQNLLEKPKIQKRIKEFANFYDASLPKKYLIYINLFYRPELGTRGTKATVYENHALVEFIPGKPAKESIGVVIHELCHFFHMVSTDKKKAAFVSRFAKSNNQYAIAAHNLSNEALATAFGNGIFAKLILNQKRYSEKLKKKNSFYNNEAIDKAAKSLIPFLEKWLSEKKTMYHPTFVNKFVKLLESRIPNLLKRPEQLLSETIYTYNPKYSKIFEEKISRTLRGGTYSGSIEDQYVKKKYENFPKLTVVAFATLSDLNKLKENKLIFDKDLQSMSSFFKKKKPFVYSVLRKDLGYTFVISGGSSSNIELEFKRLRLAKSRFVGFLN
ncbi:MAG: hypothetical protein HOO06_14425 [Bdellovibrionaceae bacterium]|nr:hypothetical protein [Pseudobdellovibrionaceae bacterium]